MKTKQYMSNKILFVALVFLTTTLYAQKYVDKKGNITFEASEKTFEPVKATNASVTAILNTDTGEMAALALMKGFRFKNSLMEEHFNENYIESEIYPKAKFKGKLLDFDYSSLSNIYTEIVVDGKIELRGKEKQIRTTLSIKKSNGSIIMQGSFKVAPADFDIEIPSIVRKKIANEIVVTLDFNLVAK